MSNQTAKADAGKPKLTLVPRQIIYDIAEVREYGNKKYGSPDNWKDVEIERYRDATFRHLMAYLENPQGVDEESGIKHLKHLACNIAFLCEMEKKAEAIKAWNTPTINSVTNDISGCLKGTHQWECCGISTAGTQYRCKACGEIKTENYDVDKSNITTSSQ